MEEVKGWLLDVYDAPRGGVVIWLLEEGDNGDPMPERRCLHQGFPVTFYASGPSERLRALWRFLESQPVPVRLARTEKRDIFQDKPLVVLAVEVPCSAAQPALFQEAVSRFPELNYYDVDISIALRYAAVHDVFPLAYCKVGVCGGKEVVGLASVVSRWDVGGGLLGLVVSSFVLDVDPFFSVPVEMAIRINESNNQVSYCLPLEPARPFLVNLNAILLRHNPDVLLTTWGDTWLLPRLLSLSQHWHIPLPLNRDPAQEIAYHPERSYFSYGQVIHRGQQIHLFGRWHIDCFNAMLFHDYGLDGILELARVTALPVQTVARVSPGTGISAMQILTALKQGILVPWHKQQAEYLKDALSLIRADQGGLVYQPLIGLHSNVAEVDFISMYPSIMARFNISPETVGKDRTASKDNANAPLIPALKIPVDQETRGLVPQTLEPLLQKRLTLKTLLATLPHWDPRRKKYKAYASAHKWLLVTCFGYLGYKNARFGRIEAHEAVTAYGREALLLAKEAAEDAGCTVLHMYVDGLWVLKPGASKVADFQPILDEVASRTGLPIALEGIYRWVAFLPSRLDERVPVANRYFGVFQDGTLKVRGIESCRHDTPPFIARAQMAILELFASVPDANQLVDYLPIAIDILRKCLSDLRHGRIPPKDLLVAQKLSRTLDKYRTPSPAARAAAQLQAVGKEVKPGQQVRFLYTRGEPGVLAWDLPANPESSQLDVARYSKLLLRAAVTVLQPFGVDEDTLRDWLFSNAGYGGQPGKITGKETRMPMPLPLIEKGFCPDLLY